MARTSSPIPLRSPSPHTLLTTLSDPLHQRGPTGIRRSQSADQQGERPSSSSSCHASLPPPPNLAPGTRSPSRRKLPAIPAGAANTKFPSVIRITRAQLQQVMSPSQSHKQTSVQLPLLLQQITSTSFPFFSFFKFKLLVLASVFSWLAYCVVLCQAALSRNHKGHCAGQAEHGSDVSLCVDMCSCDLNRGVCLSDYGMCVWNVES